MSSKSLNALVDKTTHYDKDERYMATNDLCTELSKDHSILEETVEKRICSAVLKQLDDANIEVQSVAVKCLGILFRRVKPAQIADIANRLSVLIVQGKRDLRDIYGMGLKKLISEVSPEVAERVATTAAPALLSGIGAEPVSSVTSRHTTPSPGPNDSPAAAAAAEVDIKKECLDNLAELLNKAGKHMPAEQLQLVMTLSVPLLGHAKPIVRKRAAGCLGALAVVASDALLQELVSTLLSRIDAPNSTPAGADEKRALIQCIAVLSREVGQRLGGHLGRIVPLFLRCIGPRTAAAPGTASSDGDLNNDMSNELRENCFAGLEAIIAHCPAGIAAPYVPGILQLATEFLGFDPNYCGGDEEEEGEDTDCEGDAMACGGDGEDEDGEEYEDEDDEYGYEDDEDDGMGYGDGADDDDSSWKVRKAAVKVLAAVVAMAAAAAGSSAGRSGPSKVLLDSLHSQCAAVLVRRFTERVELVRLEVVECYRALVAATILGSGAGALKGPGSRMTSAEVGSTALMMSSLAIAGGGTEGQGQGGLMGLGSLMGAPSSVPVSRANSARSVMMDDDNDYDAAEEAAEEEAEYSRRASTGESTGSQSPARPRKRHCGVSSSGGVDVSMQHLHAAAGKVVRKVVKELKTGCAVPGASARAAAATAAAGVAAARTKCALFSVLHVLARAMSQDQHGGGLTSQLASLMVVTVANCGATVPGAVRLEALGFLRTLLATQNAVALAPHLSGMLPAVLDIVSVNGSSGSSGEEWSARLIVVALKAMEQAAGVCAAAGVGEDGGISSSTCATDMFTAIYGRLTHTPAVPAGKQAGSRLLGGSSTTADANSAASTALASLACMAQTLRSFASASHFSGASWGGITDAQVGQVVGALLQKLKGHKQAAAVGGSSVSANNNLLVAVLRTLCVVVGCTSATAGSHAAVLSECYKADTVGAITTLLSSANLPGQQQQLGVSAVAAAVSASADGGSSRVVRSLALQLLRLLVEHSVGQTNGNFDTALLQSIVAAAAALVTDGDMLLCTNSLSVANAVMALINTPGGAGSSVDSAAVAGTCINTVYPAVLSLSASPVLQMPSDTATGALRSLSSLASLAGTVKSAAAVSKQQMVADLCGRVMDGAAGGGAASAMEMEDAAEAPQHTRQGLLNLSRFTVQAASSLAQADVEAVLQRLLQPLQHGSSAGSGVEVRTFSLLCLGGMGVPLGVSAAAGGAGAQVLPLLQKCFEDPVEDVKATAAAVMGQLAATSTTRAELQTIMQGVNAPGKLQYLYRISLKSCVEGHLATSAAVAAAECGAPVSVGGGASLSRSTSATGAEAGAGGGGATPAVLRRMPSGGSSGFALFDSGGRPTVAPDVQWRRNAELVEAVMGGTLLAQLAHGEESVRNLVAECIGLLLHLPTPQGSTITTTQLLGMLQRQLQVAKESASTTEGANTLAGASNNVYKLTMWTVTTALRYCMSRPVAPKQTASITDLLSSSASCPGGVQQLDGHAVLDLLLELIVQHNACTATAPEGQSEPSSQISLLDCEIRRAALLVVNAAAHYNRAVLQPVLRAASTTAAKAAVVPQVLFASLTFQQERTVDLGLFKHKVDDAAPIRKAALLCAETLLIRLRSDIDGSALLHCLVGTPGVAGYSLCADKDEGIKGLALQLLAVLCSSCPAVLVGSSSKAGVGLGGLIAALTVVIDKAVKAAAKAEAKAAPKELSDAAAAGAAGTSAGAAAGAAAAGTSADADRQYELLRAAGRVVHMVNTRCIPLLPPPSEAAAATAAAAGDAVVASVTSWTAEFMPNVVLRVPLLATYLESRKAEN